MRRLLVRRLRDSSASSSPASGFVGFKFVGPKMTETRAVIGGEESGGFGFGMHIPERDGLASGLFLLDLWLTKGTKASEVLAELQALAGRLQEVDLYRMDTLLVPYVAPAPSGARPR